MNLGKLELAITLTELIEREIYGNTIELLEIKPEDLDELAKPYFYHKDPFDRLMIAQSLAEAIPTNNKRQRIQELPCDNVECLSVVF